MENCPLVSIITIVFNGESHLEKTIESVLGQTYPNIEYIIIDGGSTDNTVSIIKKYESRLGGWISEKDRGISDAFNKGIARASGDIIGIINADDWYEPYSVAEAVNAMQNADVVYGDLRLLRNGQADFVVKGNFQLLYKVMSVNHPTVFVKKTLYGQYGMFDESYSIAMDYDLVLRLAVNECRFSYIPRLLANMRWDGASDKNWFKGCRETLHIKNKYLPHRKLLNYLFFLRHVSGIVMPRFMEKLRLRFLVNAYRKRYALQKKVYEDIHST